MIFFDVLRGLLVTLKNECLKNSIYKCKNFWNYSLRPKLSTKSCLMKQKCQLQTGIVKYENAATPLSTSGINTTHQHFQMRYIALFQLKGLKSYQPKYKCKVYFTKEIYTFKLRQLITFETLELKQSYMPHLKVLMCGIDA